jgi:hypothetical protein
MVAESPPSEAVLTLIQILRDPSESAIHAQATFSTEGNANAGPVKFEVKWFNGQRRVSVKKIDAVVSTSPHFVAVQSSGNAVGEGDCRVEVHANGKLMASQRFRVDAI